MNLFYLNIFDINATNVVCPLWQRNGPEPQVIGHTWTRTRVARETVSSGVMFKFKHSIELR
ncbi:uncharacterized protein LACBIDRAFT_315350 [Laccaria bicolor S238N-H82]|uniref:Predicted protein n=1 Tax=Laccaria bicolor (strain S238N-H82 / ATCC MYA-4686) TaxID=486041 RepID=B0D269_LACBS|nr:uncharacterized protein LACBIDRAFT_315350 [Laccaria bicolor S238N-H82]EDR10690.1 predicted protein [Laccaria bicolor S238N-H82]|eukprot:XP_001877991.1 predicted protein [Laccaria bicolor S238N-H82]